ncbi:hypothetical protein DY000_02007670 [Brassica cretica]|uniref:Uncharacterized protein n=1 Tax=Brassica cretica TaxID=69181 RepID=A0ABQ7C5M1_BRACR|nr:hypothetical protein DY000_02007670 [Brassica cretica]
MPKIDVARLNALMPKPKPSENILETVRTPLDDGVDPMEVDRVHKGRTLRKRKERVAKHLKRGANEKEKESFRKRVFMIPLDKPFNEAYYTHRLWMFFRETRETEEDIRRMFCEAREKMRMRITLKKKNDPGKFAIPCTVKGLQVEPSQELFTFVDFSQRNSGGIVRDLEVQIVGAVCNLQTNQLCLTLIDPNAHYDPIPVKKPQTISRRINDPGIIAACHCGAEYETEYSASIETHTATSIDSAIKKLTDTPKEKSVDSSQGEWEKENYIPTMATHPMHTEEYDEYYEEERAIEKRATLDEEDRLLHHSSWKNKSPSIDRYGSTWIDTQPHQPNHLRASTDNAYFPSIDTNVDATRDGDYSIGSWADNRYHESYTVETTYRDQEDDELNEGFTYEELLNMQRRKELDQNRAASAWERTRFSHPIDRESRPSIDTYHSQSIDINNTTSINIRPKPKTTVSEKDKSDNQYLTPDEFGIFRDPDGYARAINGRLTIQLNHRSTLTFQHRSTKGQNSAEVLSIFWVPGDSTGKRRMSYGIYIDDQGCARDLDGHTIRVHNRDIRRLLERASRDEPSYICLPEHASSFTQNKMVPEIYTKDEINEMLYGVCGEHEKNKEVFQMKLDGLYYPLNDRIS